MPAPMDDLCRMKRVQQGMGPSPNSKETRVGLWFAASVLLPLGIAAPTAAQTPDTTPSGMIAFFMSSGVGCPTGWQIATQPQGRVLVGIATGAEVGTTVGSPMADQTDPTHNHGFYPSVTLPSRNIAAAHCCNNQGAKSGTYVLITSEGPPRVPFVFTDPSTSNLPFMQLVICQKQ